CFSMYIFMATFIGLIMNSKCQQTLIVLATLIAISYSYREHSIAKYLMFFFIAVLIILSGAALYIALLL
ncbi:hypothetical protein, partial [Acinetobacter baumannii]|uniref:hypothetical protein n=1 Tax=Acinetobacter baumannii TaxID=470 RepID=UPI00387B0147